MATEITNAPFESLKEDIVKVFEILHRKLDERKQFLMGQLRAIKEETENSSDLDKGIKKLKETKELMLANLQDNVLGKEREAIEKTLDDQIMEAEARRLAEKSCMVKLRCYIAKIKEDISQISLVEEISAYVSKLIPIIKCGKVGPGQGEFGAPRAICIDKSTSNVYIADRGNKRIQVLSKAGVHVNAFSTRYLTEPWGVAVTEQFVFVTDHAKSSLVQFSIDGSFIKTAGSPGSGAPLAFNCPRGIAAYDNKLYICDCGNHRIQVIATSLKYIEEFTSGELTCPSDIHITSDSIHVLPQSGNIVHLFSHTGYKLLQVVKLIGQEYNMTGHLYFTVDQLGNYLISTEKEHHILIFDHTGKLKQSIGDGQMKFPRGISVDDNDNIICVTGAGNNRFQLY